MRPAAPMAAVALLVLAGCGGATVGGGGSAPSVTPAPVPTDTPGEPSEGTPPRLAPGLSAEGVVDPWAASSAHRAHLRAANYTVRTVEVTRDPDGRLRSRIARTVRIGQNGTPVHTVIDVNGSTAATAWRVAHVELWADADTVYETTVGDGGRNYDAYPRTYTATRRTLFQLFAATTTRVAGEAVRNGTTVYRVEAVDLASPTLLAGAEGVEEPRNVTFVAHVDPTGLVRAYRLAYTARDRGRTVRVVRTVEYVRVGETRLERPAWVDRAANETGVGADAR